MEKNSKILLALGIGVAVGGLLGIFFAPDKGSETRKKIKNAGHKLSEDINDKLKRGKEDLYSMKDKIKDRLDAVDEKVRELV